ncbi:hypothetical protein [Actinomadura gamaensis]
MVEQPQTGEQLARIDTKLDVLISQHGHVAAQVADHEVRVRELEAAHHRTDSKVTDQGADLADHETRLRAADRWRYALPVTAAGSLLTGTAAILAALGKH